MWKGKRLHDWDQTGELVAILANANRDRRRRRSPFRKSECVPKDLAKEYRQLSGIRLTRGTLHALKPLFKRGDT